MANPTQQDFQRLTEAMEKLSGAMGGGTGRQSGYSSRSSAVSSDGNIDFSKLRNEIKNNSSVFAEAFKKMNASLKGVGDIYKNLEKSTRDQDSKTRALNKTIADFIAKASNSVDELEKLSKMSSDVNKNMKNYAASIKDYQEKIKTLNTLQDKQKDAYQMLIKAQEELAKARKNKKNTTSAKTKELFAKATIKAYKDQIDTTKAAKAELDKTLKSIEEFNKVTGALTDEQLAQLKNYKDINLESKEYAESIEALHKTTGDFDKGLGNVANTLADRAKKIDDSFAKFGASLKKAALELVTVGFATGYKDYLAQLKNNVNQSDYKNDLLMGVSESERSNIIGENRTGLRVLGNGNEQEGFRGGGREIQKAGWQYGVTGADALKLGLGYQNDLINSGFKGTASATADQMTVMHNFAKDLGVTDDALKSFYDNLRETGEMGNLQAKYSNLSEDERRKAINIEVKNRLALNTQLGISLDLQKKINQENINKQFGGVAAAVMRSISGKQDISQYNKDNPNAQITGRDADLYNRFSLNGDAGMSAEDSARAKELKENVEHNRVVQMQSAAGKGLGAFIGQSISHVDVPRALGTDVGGGTTDWNNAWLRRQGLEGTQTVASSSYDDSQKQIINTTSNAFLDLNGSITKLNSTILNVVQGLEGAAANPAGKAAGSAISGVGNFAGSLLGSYLGGKGGKFLGKVGSKVAGSTVGKAAGSIFGKFGAKEAGKLGAKTVGKSLLKKIPLIGLLAGLGFAGYRALDGDWSGAGEEVASGAASTIPGIGTAASVGIDAHLAYRDAMKDQQAALDKQHLANLSTSDISNMFQNSIQPNNNRVSPNLSSVVAVDDSNNGNNGNDKLDAVVDNLDKIAKTSQEQLDLQKKAQDKQDNKAAAENGAIFKNYRDHVADLRKGVTS